MSDSSPRRPTFRRILSAAAGLATVVALVLTPASASAADPTSAENFSPDATPAAGATNDTLLTVVSDRSDGGNATFHATTVTTADATLVQYYICPVAFPDEQVGSAVDAGDPTSGTSGCGPAAAVDSTGTPVPGVVPPGAGVPGGPGEAYEADIDILSSKEGNQDFVAWVCTATTATAADCDAEVEPNIVFDDGGTNPDTASSSGEIVAPVHGANVSNLGFVASARTSPDVTAVTFCLAAESAAGEAADEGDGTAGDGDPATCVTDADFAGPGTTTTIKTDIEPNNPSSQQTTFKTWSATYSDAETPDGLELALVVYEGTSADGDPPTGPAPLNPAASGAGSCAGGTNDCQLDSHYIVTTPAVGTTAVVAFPDEGPTGTMPNNCNEAEATSIGNEEPKQYSRIQGCILDQSGNNVTNNVHWAFSITQQDAAGTATDETGFECQTAAPGRTCSDTTFPAASANTGEHQVPVAPPAPGNWPNYECNGRNPGPITTPGSGCPSGPVGADGIQYDSNGDRFYEVVDGDPGQTAGGTAGIADEVVEFHTTGVYQIIFCLDAGDDAKTSTAPCATDTVQSTGTKTVTGPPDHVHMKRADQADALCHSGDTVTTAPAGTTLALRGCAIALIEGAEQPSIGSRVLWLVNPPGTTGDTGSIASQESTTDVLGQADAQVTAPASANGGVTTVRFCLDNFPASTTGGQNGNGTCDAADSASGAPLTTMADLRINWGDAAQGLCDPLRTKAEDQEILVGTNDADRICGFGGRDTIRGLGGDDTLIGADGRDTLLGGSGDDLLSGGPGRDTARGAGGDDVMRGSGGRDLLKGGGGRDAARAGAGKDKCSAEQEKQCER